ncbi:MAG: hypothetical protein B5766_12560 [Candidatus Lumbricidophila eiseniae]|uniref:Glucosamine-6-phosphate isomerase n=1 Tax=Candidatus Lumbricidiphila eiseniae TaxID=1969409 RepID=A0A2A6FPD5_9MICO|nr:MAG: hypothetical protein B5766_12560 [Candidatus Lumbricidophila eiseniae]
MSVNFQVVPHSAAVHERFAHAIADEIHSNNLAGKPTRLILPVGPIAHYPLLAQLCNKQHISWRDVRFTIMDEYLDWTGRPIPAEHPLSFVGFMRQFIGTLDSELQPPVDGWVWPDPFEINRVAEFIADIGGIDTCYGGIGVHGHVAFNEPVRNRFWSITDDQFRASPTRVVTLAPETIVMNATRATGGSFDTFPPLAVTIGMRDILEAVRIRLFCDGGVWQQEAVARAVCGPSHQDYPVSLLRHHRDVTVCADRVSAAGAIAAGAIPTPENR